MSKAAWKLERRGTKSSPIPSTHSHAEDPELVSGIDWLPRTTLNFVDEYSSYVMSVLYRDCIQKKKQWVSLLLVSAKAEKQRVLHHLINWVGDKYKSGSYLCTSNVWHHRSCEEKLTKNGRFIKRRRSYKESTQPIHSLKKIYVNVNFREKKHAIPVCEQKLTQQPITLQISIWKAMNDTPRSA